MVTFAVGAEFGVGAAFDKEVKVGFGVKAVFGVGAAFDQEVEVAFRVGAVSDQEVKVAFRIRAAFRVGAAFIRADFRGRVVFGGGLGAVAFRVSVGVVAAFRVCAFRWRSISFGIG